MPVPGDRRDVICRRGKCGAKILLIYSVGGKWIPCERLSSHVDGERMLVFANGVVGRTYADYTAGNETHFAHCPNADDFRKHEPPKEEAPSPQGTLDFNDRSV